MHHGLEVGSHAHLVANVTAADAGTASVAVERVESRCRRYSTHARRPSDTTTGPSTRPQPRETPPDLTAGLEAATARWSVVYARPLRCGAVACLGAESGSSAGATSPDPSWTCSQPRASPSPSSTSSMRREHPRPWAQTPSVKWSRADPGSAAAAHEVVRQHHPPRPPDASSSPESPTDFARLSRAQLHAAASRVAAWAGPGLASRPECARSGWPRSSWQMSASICLALVPRLQPPESLRERRRRRDGGWPPCVPV